MGIYLCKELGFLLVVGFVFCLRNEIRDLSCLQGSSTGCFLWVQEFLMISSL